METKKAFQHRAQGPRPHTAHPTHPPNQGVSDQPGETLFSMCAHETLTWPPSSRSFASQLAEPQTLPAVRHSAPAAAHGARLAPRPWSLLPLHPAHRGWGVSGRECGVHLAPFHEDGVGKGSAGPAPKRPPPMCSLLSSAPAGNLRSCSFGNGAAEGLLLKFSSGVLVFSKFARHERTQQMGLCSWRSRGGHRQLQKHRQGPGVFVS